MFASTARTAVDIEGIRVLQSFGAEGLEMPAEDVPMIRAARELGIP